MPHFNTSMWIGGERVEFSTLYSKQEKVTFDGMNYEAQTVRFNISNEAAKIPKKSFGNIEEFKMYFTPFIQKKPRYRGKCRSVADFTLEIKETNHPLKLTFTTATQFGKVVLELTESIVKIGDTCSLLFEESEHEGE
uniref:AlNc14C375G11152 protein n=1 Tax=Albugo laibachii Nc14 TaxID=890382 RepID=F0WY92_9STRA|nr:AlNc14C375G11152 [Albugo laibachii Nc14]|eukprot:CCA26444.1 AlNc14C375G11152 [Albugo laibachii Nc14]